MLLAGLQQFFVFQLKFMIRVFVVDLLYAPLSPRWLRPEAN